MGHPKVIPGFQYKGTSCLCHNLHAQPSVYYTWTLRRRVPNTLKSFLGVTLAEYPPTALLRFRRCRRALERYSIDHVSVSFTSAAAAATPTLPLYPAQPSPIMRTASFLLHPPNPPTLSKADLGSSKYRSSTVFQLLFPNMAVIGTGVSFLYFAKVFGSMSGTAEDPSRIGKTCLLIPSTTTEGGGVARGD